MAEISIHLPSLLAHAVGGKRRVAVVGSTLSEALLDLKTRLPTLAVHLFDETGDFREHVLCFLNETNTRWLASLDHPVEEGDTLTIVQAVSGG